MLQASSEDGESSRTPRLVLAVLGVAYALAYFDRQVLTLLVDPIRRSTGLSDTQVGLLQGFAFAFCFAIGGLPLGWLVDNVNRVRLAGVCVMLWSVATSAMGFASTYTQLLLARSATALAEAGCSPAATSIFAGIFPPRRLPWVTSFYMTAPIIGGGAALLTGGYALKHFERSGGLNFPWIGHLLPWQSVFASLATPGLLLGLFILVVLREPARNELSGAPARAMSLRRMFRFVAQDSPYLLSYFGAYACILTALFSLLTWYPTLAIRSGFGAASIVGKRVGLTFLLCGLIGTLGAQWLIGRVRDADVVPRVMRVASYALGSLIAASVLLWLTASANASLAAYGWLILSLSVLTAIMPIPLQVGVPNRMRGRLVGLFIMSINLIGTGLGPVAVGRMSDSMGSTTHSLVTALAAVLFLSTIGALAFILNAARRIRLAQQMPAEQLVF